MANPTFKPSRIGLLTSGGDSPGMNACIRAVVRTCVYHRIQPWGIRRGFQGLIEGDMWEMKSHDASNIIQRGGTILKTARCKAFMASDGRAEAAAQLQKNGIEALVVIGGDGTYKGADTLLQEYPNLKIVGCPGTIDNDLFGTDYTIGFDTAINTAVRAIDQIRDTADATNRLFFVEVMGRDAGFIALYAGIGGGAEAVLIPETLTDMEALVRTLESGWQHKKSSSIVIVAEGDDAGGAFAVAEQVKARFAEYETRVSILGHIQRGGAPSAQDRMLASQFGSAAVEALLLGMSGVAIGRVHHAITYTPFDQAIKFTSKINSGLAHLIEVLSV